MVIYIFCISFFFLFVKKKRKKFSKPVLCTYMQVCLISCWDILYNLMIFIKFNDLFQIFAEYFKELEEESIRDNFVVIYELLDEVMDFGYPQTTDSKILQE